MLWRLLHTPAAADHFSSCGVIPLLLDAMEIRSRSSHCEALRRAAVASIRLLFDRGDLFHTLVEARAPERLERLVASSQWEVATRYSAVIALEEWNRKARLQA